MDSLNEKIIGMQTIKEAFMNAADVFLRILIFRIIKLALELWLENFTWQQEQLWSFQETVTIKTLLLFYYYYYYWFSLLSMCWKTIHSGHCRSASASWLLTESYSFLLLLLSSTSGEMRGNVECEYELFCLLTRLRIIEEFSLGERQYWALERQLCPALMNQSAVLAIIWCIFA